MMSANIQGRIWLTKTFIEPTRIRFLVVQQMRRTFFPTHHRIKHTDSSAIVALIDTSMNIMQEVVASALFEELEEFDTSSLDLGITIIDSLTYFGGLFSDHEMEPEARYCFQKAINGLKDEVWWNGEMEKLGLTPKGEWQKMNDLLLQNIEALDNPHGGAIQIFGESLDYVILFTFISPSRTADPRNEDLDDGPHEQKRDE